MSVIIAPSLLAADFANLNAAFNLINNSEADWLHIDVMDGVFVPNISFGFPVMEAAKKYCKKPLDVHLMIVDPDKYIETFAKLGATYITVHYEACPHLHRTIQLIKSFGCKAGVALNPHTPVSVLEDVINDLDLVLIMSVNPGFGGQKFIENAYKKVHQTRNLILAHKSNAIIEVDGGVNTDIAKKLKESGATAFVAGSFVFNSKSPEETIKEMKKI